jgi:hypothetical protein
MGFDRVSACRLSLRAFVSFGENWVAALPRCVPLWQKPQFQTAPPAIRFQRPLVRRAVYGVALLKEWCISTLPLELFFNGKSRFCDEYRRVQVSPRRARVAHGEYNGLAILAVRLHNH